MRKGVPMSGNSIEIEIGANPIGAKLDAHFLSLGMGMNFDGLRRARMAQIVELELKSDRELLKIGLRREDIASYVFRDILSW